MRPLLLCTVASVMSVLISVPAGAQSAPAPSSGDDNRLSDIVVTARRVEENLQQTPIAVTAFNQQALQDRNVANVRDITNLVPNLVATHGPAANGADANFFVRGIGQEDYNATRDPGVGLYLDGVYIGRTSGAALENLDIERIEVLRGPQGTLFGRNTIGGAVNVATIRPDGSFGGKVVGTLGERNRYDVKGYVQFPVAGPVAGLISVVSRNQDGWVKRALDGTLLGTTRLLATRAKLAGDLGGGFRFLLTGDYTRSRGTAYPTLLAVASTTKTVPNLVFVNGPNNPPVLQSPPEITVPRTTPFGVPLPSGMNSQVCPSRDCDVSYQSGQVRNPADIWGLSLAIDWNIGSVAFKSITAYRHLKVVSTPDFDGSSYVVFDQVNPTRQSQFSQELNASASLFGNALKLIGGLYYYRERVDQRPSIYFGSNQNELAPVAADAFRGVTTNQFIKPRDETAAAYLQGTLALAPRLTATLGGRFTYERKTIDYNIFIDNRQNGIDLSLNYGQRPDLLPPYPFFVPRGAILNSNIPSQSRDWKPFTYRAGLEYQATPDILLYGSVASGFRSGGFNGRPTQPAEATAFQPEKTTSYELGLKTELFDRTTRLNLAAFYTDYSDIQVLVQKGVFFAFDNTVATLKGFEAELVTQPVRGFRLEASVGYIASRIDRTVSATIVEGARLAGSPEWTVHIAPQYRFDLPAGSHLTARVDYSFQSRVKFYNSSAPILGEQPPYSLVNGRLTWSSADDRYAVAAYALNLFDKRYITEASVDLNTFGTNTVEPAPPREVGVELTFKF